MDDPRFEGRLFGDLSAITQLNRAGPALAAIVERSEWHTRLLNGSDYPLLFDFVLKRNVRVNGKGFAAAVFETRAFFTPRRQAVPHHDFSGQLR